MFIVMKKYFFIFFLLSVGNILLAQSVTFPLDMYSYTNGDNKETEFGKYTATFSKTRITTDDKMVEEPALKMIITDENGKTVKWAYFCKTYKSRILRCDNYFYNKRGESAEAWSVTAHSNKWDTVDYMTYGFLGNRFYLLFRIMGNDTYCREFVAFNPSKDLNMELFYVLKSGSDAGFMELVTCDNPYYYVVEAE